MGQIFELLRLFGLRDLARKKRRHDRALPILRGYCATSSLWTLFDTGVMDELKQGARTADELAAKLSLDARAHYHKRLTETYYFLECGADARMELDGEVLPVKPGMAILIPPGIRHRAIGEMKVLILVLPKFDPADEW